MAKKVEINGRGRISSIVFFEDGKYFLSGGDESTIRQWRVDDGVEVGEGMKTGSTITSMALSDDGKWIVSSGKQVANVWSRVSRQIVVTVSEHSDWVDTVHVSPDSTKFATGSNDKKVFICDILTGKKLRLLKHENRVGAVRFSPDGQHIATGTAGGTLRIFDTHRGNLLRTIPISITSYPSPIAWFSTQSVFVIVSRNTLMHIDANTGRSFTSWTIPGEPANYFDPIALGSVVSSRNSKFIVTFAGHSISLWDTSTFARISSDIRHPAQVRSIALSWDNNCLAISDANGKITLRNLNSIISDYYLVDEHVQQPRTRSVDDLQPQVEALQGKLRTLELRIDELSDLSQTSLTTLEHLSNESDGTIAQPENLHEAITVVAPHILNGTYRIKSKTDDSYLARSQGGTGVVVPKQLDTSDASQKWFISLVEDGAYTIICRLGNSDVPLSTEGANKLVCVPDKYGAWTIEPRGNAYVIGNVMDGRAIRLVGRKDVSVTLRDNTQEQRWILERVIDCEGA